MRGVQTRTLYNLLGRINTNVCTNAIFHKYDSIYSCLVDFTMLWHQWMGDIGEKGLLSMKNKGMVKCIPDFSLEIEFFEHCIYGKQNHVSFPSGAARDKEILKLIHIDVFELILVQSLVGSQYYVSFIDDFYKMTWMYFPRKKYEVFEKFQEFKTLI